MLAVIDGDEIVYKLSHQYQDVYWNVIYDSKPIYRCKDKEDAVIFIDNDEVLSIEKEIVALPLDGLKHKVKELIGFITESSKTTDVLIPFNGINNFRYNLATLLPYKGNREDIKPINFYKIKEFIEESYRTTSVDYLESDDILAHYGNLKYDSVVICSTDKDLKTVPSNNFDIMHNVCSIITEQEARYNFWYQILIGDSTDNIPSPFNLGPVRAKKILPTAGADYSDLDYYNAVVPEYLKYLLAKSNGEYYTKWYKDQYIDFILNEVGNLLWMKRDLGSSLEWQVPKRT